MAKRAVCSLVVAVFVMMIAAGNAFGCFCGPEGTPCLAYGHAAAVFVGTAISVKRNDPPGLDLKNPDFMKMPDRWMPVTATFAVEQSFLGVSDSQVEVSLDGSTCAYSFKVGTRYVVYASRYSGNKLTTNKCTRTAEADKAQDDIEFLRTLNSRVAGASISGSVVRRRGNVATGDSTVVGPGSGLSLLIQGERESKVVTTDADGRYSAAGLTPGKFKVTLNTPDEIYVYKRDEEITIADRGCAEVSYIIGDNGRVSGTVLDADGQPVPKVLVGLVDAEHSDVNKSNQRLEQADEKGHYSFLGLPPGRYLVAVNLTRYPEPNDPTGAFPRTYYPGVTDLAKAEAITVGPGENAGERNIKMTTRREASVIRGKIVWDDGTAVANAGILYRDVTDQNKGLAYQATADEQGYFTINGFVGQTFIMTAFNSRSHPGDPVGKIEAVRVVMSKATETVNIVITKMK